MERFFSPGPKTNWRQPPPYVDAEKKEAGRNSESWPAGIPAGWPVGWPGWLGWTARIQNSSRLEFGIPAGWLAGWPGWLG